MSWKERVKQIKIDVPAIFLVLKEEKTPWYAKVMAGITVAYALSPIDLIPDFIPVLGYLDDMLILPLLILLTIRLIPGDVFEECRSRAEDMWKDGKPKQWYFALPIIFLWILLIGWVISLWIG